MEIFALSDKYNIETLEAIYPTTTIIGDLWNTKPDTLCLSRPYAQLTQFGGSDFGVSF